MGRSSRLNRCLACYPFIDRRVRLVEGFAAYDGVLGDEPGAPHQGIDYALSIDGHLQPFDVFSMHDGVAFRGRSTTWGEFVSIYSREFDTVQYVTIYAHLDEIIADIPLLPKPGAEGVGEPVQSGDRLGCCGASGQTNGIPQLHVELHRKNLATGERERLDPYGVYDRTSSGRYPQPGESLAGLSHFWTSSVPHFPRG